MEKGYKEEVKVIDLALTLFLGVLVSSGAWLFAALQKRRWDDC